KMPAATQRAERAAVGDAPTSVVRLARAEGAAWRGLLLQEAVQELRLLLESLHLPAQPVDLTFESGNPIVQAATHLPVAFEPRRKGTAQLRIEDHRDQRDQQGKKEENYDCPHDVDKLSRQRRARQGDPLTAWT